MADNLENISFSIEDTMDYGVGNQQLLQDLVAPETASEDPNNITPIVKEVEDKKEPQKKTPKVKEIPSHPQ